MKYSVREVEMWADADGSETGDLMYVLLHIRTGRDQYLSDEIVEAAELELDRLVDYFKEHFEIVDDMLEEKVEPPLQSYWRKP